MQPEIATGRIGSQLTQGRLLKTFTFAVKRRYTPKREIKIIAYGNF